MLFTASWRPGLPTGTWIVQRNGEVFASLRRKVLSPLHRCVVNMNGETFLLQNRPTFTRTTEVKGGRFDGATLFGNLMDLKFRIEHRERLIAEAEAKVLSLHDAHVVHIRTEHDPAAEQLAALMMIDLLIQMREEF